MAEKKTDEKQLRERFTNDLEVAKKFMDPIHLLMDKYYEQYRNRNNAETDNKFRISDLYGYVETVVPILTNSRVRATVKSDYPKYVQHAQGLTDILDHAYDINNWDYESQEIARMAEIYRSSIAYTGYDGDYRNGTGKICVTGCNIRWCYLDPGASKFDDSSFFFYVEPKRKTEVFKLYPDKKDEIEQSIGKRDAIDKTDSRVRRWFQTFFSSIKNYLNFNSTNMTAQPMTPLYEEMMEMDEEEKHKNSVAFVHHWYRDEDDKWRVAYWADDVFLEDMENPFLHGRLPYDIYNPTKDILSSMGVPMAEHIEHLNWEKNVMMHLIIQSAKRAVDPPLMYNTAAGLKDPQSIREKAQKTGTIPINNPDFAPLNSIADFVSLPQLPGFVDNLPERFGMMEDRLTGVNDSFRGMSTATSGKEVQLKQEAAYTRIKTKIDNFELFNKSIAEKLIILAMQYYDKNRAFRIKGDYTKHQSIIDMQQQADPNAPAPPFDVQPIKTGVNPDTQQPTFDRSEYYLYANPNEWTKIEEAPADQTDPNVDPTMQIDPVNDPTAQTAAPEDAPNKDDVKQAFRILQMTVEIEAGSSLPQSRMARREEAIDLFKSQAIDQEALLDAYDWPNKEEVVKRMQEAAKALQDAQMQAQQGQAQAQAEQQTASQQAQQQHQMEVKQMELAAQDQQTQANNATKLQAVQTKQQAQQPDVASQLDALRQAMPELANMSDEELLKLVANLQNVG